MLWMVELESATGLASHGVSLSAGGRVVVLPWHGGLLAAAKSARDAAAANGIRPERLIRDTLALYARRDERVQHVREFPDKHMSRTGSIEDDGKEAKDGDGDGQ
jgi:hypothetical protein